MTMTGKKNDATETPTGQHGPTGTDLSGQTPSRLSAAIMRILATARGATEGHRTIKPADLQPPRLHGQADPRARKDEDVVDGDESSNVEWSLRMMQ